MNSISSYQAHPEACLLDLDGTLVDTLGDFVAVLNLMLADLSLPAVAAATVEHTVGQGSEHLIRTVLLQQGGASDLFDAAWESYQRHYATVNGQFASVYPGVIEGLQDLRRRGLPLACVTNKPARFARDLLERKGLASYFIHVFGGDDFERKKPDPLPLLKACEALGRRPASSWMIGDSSNDARAARAAGCPVGLLSHGYNHGQPISEVDCDLRADSLQALVAQLPG